MFYHWLMGMEVNPLDWKISDLTLWLISVSAVYLLCGKSAERENGTLKYYKTIRYGRRKDFWRHVCGQQIKIVCLFSLCSFFIILALSYAADAEVIHLPWRHLGAGAVLFALNHSVLGIIQALIILTLGCGNMVFMAMMVMELLALFFSLGSFTGWNPFNWDMLIRSGICGESGFDIRYTISVQMIALAVVLLSGDKFLKNKME